MTNRPLRSPRRFDRLREALRARWKRHIAHDTAAGRPVAAQIDTATPTPSDGVSQPDDLPTAAQRAFRRHVAPVVEAGGVGSLLDAVKQQLLDPYGAEGLEVVRTRLLRATRHLASADWHRLWSKLDDYAYRKWLARHELDGAAVAALRERVAARGGAPQFELVTVGSGDCATTIASWRDQHPWQETAAGADQPVWTVVVASGATLRPYALLLLADAILDTPDAHAVTADADLAGGDGHLAPLFKPMTWDPVLAGNGRILWPLTAVRNAELSGRGNDANITWADVLANVAKLPAERIVHVAHMLCRADRSALPGNGQTPAAEPASWPSVSIVVPTRDRVELLRVCVEGVLDHTDYPGITLTIVDNGSVEDDTLRYLADLGERDDVTIIPAPGPFNFSALVNLGARASQNDIIVLLNNDIEIIDGSWLKAMVRELVRDGVGAVGAVLLYPDGRVQHAGVTLGTAHPVAGHAFRHVPADHDDPVGRLQSVRTCSAATGACLAVRRSVFDQVGGLDEVNLAISYNDVDLCLRIAEAGHRILVTPHARLIHHEAASRGPGEKVAARAAQRDRERDFMLARWGHQLAHDPYLNPNLTLHAEDLSVATRSRASSR